MPELINADGCENCDNGLFSMAFRERLGGTTSDPATPVESYDRESDAPAAAPHSAGWMAALISWEISITFTCDLRKEGF